MSDIKKTDINPKKITTHQALIIKENYKIELEISYNDHQSLPNHALFTAVKESSPNVLI
jgi:hypothetical protein